MYNVSLKTYHHKIHRCSYFCQDHLPVKCVMVPGNRQLASVSGARNWHRKQKPENGQGVTNLRTVVDLPGTGMTACCCCWCSGCWAGGDKQAVSVGLAAVVGCCVTELMLLLLSWAVTSVHCMLWFAGSVTAGSDVAADVLLLLTIPPCWTPRTLSAQLLPLHRNTQCYIDRVPKLVPPPYRNISVQEIWANAHEMHESL